MTEPKPKPKKIEQHLFDMCVALGDYISFQKILETKKDKGRQCNAQAHRAYDTLMYVLKKKEPKNKFSSQKTIDYLNDKLGAFYSKALLEFAESLIVGL